MTHVAPPFARLPTHVAIIMDGNGRWAEKQGLGRAEGHQAGALSVRTIVEESARLGIKYLTLYSFSTENWKRPVEEVAALMELFATYLVSERSNLLANKIRLRVIGDVARLEPAVQKALHEVCEATAQGERMELILALSYGSRDEILHAVKKIARSAQQGETRIDDITAETFSKSLYTAEIPDPDLLIRTSGEFRVSNFLLWQIAYSEIIVTEVLWPEFKVPEFHSCLAEYEKRERRFGLTKSQIRADEAAASPR